MTCENQLRTAIQIRNTQSAITDRPYFHPEAASSAQPFRSKHIPWSFCNFPEAHAFDLKCCCILRDQIGADSLLPNKDGAFFDIAAADVRDGGCEKRSSKSQCFLHDCARFMSGKGAGIPCVVPSKPFRWINIRYAYTRDFYPDRTSVRVSCSMSPDCPYRLYCMIGLVLRVISFSKRLSAHMDRSRILSHVELAKGIEETF